MMVSRTQGISPGLKAANAGCMRRQIGSTRSRLYQGLAVSQRHLKRHETFSESPSHSAMSVSKSAPASSRSHIYSLISRHEKFDDLGPASASSTLRPESICTQRQWGDHGPSGDGGFAPDVCCGELARAARAELTAGNDFMAYDLHLH